MVPETLLDLRIHLAVAAAPVQWAATLLGETLEQTAVRVCTPLLPGHQFLAAVEAAVLVKPRAAQAVSVVAVKAAMGQRIPAQTETPILAAAQEGNAQQAVILAAQVLLFFDTKAVLAPQFPLASPQQPQQSETIKLPSLLLEQEQYHGAK